MRYKAGDKVVINSEITDDMKKTLNEQMLIWRGCIMTISACYPEGYNMKQDEGYWIFNDDWINHEATAKLNETCEGDIPHISAIKDSGQRSEFPTGAVRDMSEGKGRMDLLCWNAIMEVSKHCEEGAKKYGENNVDKGIPMHSLADSAMRHMAKFIAGHKDEDHLRAAAWNILWALEFRETRPELNDLYYWNKDSVENTQGGNKNV